MMPRKPAPRTASNKLYRLSFRICVMRAGSPLGRAQSSLSRMVLFRPQEPKGLNGNGEFHCIRACEHYSLCFLTSAWGGLDLETGAGLPQGEWQKESWP